MRYLCSMEIDKLGLEGQEYVVSIDTIVGKT